MKFCDLAALCLLLVETSAASIEKGLFPRDGKGYLELAINSPGFQLDDHAYYEFSIGNPPQLIRASIDTGSHRAWFKKSDEVKKNYYDPKDSKTSKYINNDFKVKYLRGEAHGDYYNDVLNFDGISPISLQFGVVNESDINPVFGISPGEDPTSLPLALKNQGVTKSVSYSFTGQPGSSHFTLTFGAVDRNRYDGELKFLPWSKKRDFSLDLDYLIVKGNKIETNFPILFDTGTTFFHFEPRIYDEIVKTFGGKTVGKYEVLIGDGKRCEELDLKPFEFSFANGQSVIKVPTEPIAHYEEKHKSCVLYIESSTSNLFPLSAMHDVYLAWNNDKKTIAVTNNKKATTKNIQLIL